MGVCHSKNTKKSSSNQTNYTTITTTTTKPVTEVNKDTNATTKIANNNIPANNHINTNNNSNDLLTSSQPKKIKQVRNFVPKSEMSKLEDVYLNYKFIRDLGSGSFGVVREVEVINKNNSNIPKDSKKFAIKTIQKDKVEDESFLREEIEISLAVDNEYIIKCYEVYEDPKHVHYVMELIEGGDLFDYIINSPSMRLEEKESLYLFMQMVQAVQYMHLEGFMHRDIKPENFLVYYDINDNNKLKLKLTDFGFACSFNVNEKKKDKVGSINYVAPEMLDDITEDAPYDFKIDIWALGVCLYNMVSGKQPFTDDDIEELAKKIRNKPVSFNQPVFNSINYNVKEFIASILEKDPNKRPCASDIRVDQWLNNYLGSLDEIPTLQIDVKFDKKNVDNIKNLINYKKNIKPDFWGLCLENLKTATAVSIYNNFLEENKSDLFAQKLMSFEKLIIIILDFLQNESLKNNKYKSEYDECILIFKQFMFNNKEDCNSQMINYIDFFDKLVKSGELIYKEKVWNIYKNLITYDDGNSISISSLIELMDKKKMVYNKTNLSNKSKMDFDELLNFFNKEKIEFN